MTKIYEKLMTCGTSHRQIALQLGVTPSRLSRWASGHHPVPLEFVGRLSQRLDMSPLDIRPDLRQLGPDIVKFLDPKSALPIEWPTHGP